MVRTTRVAHHQCGVHPERDLRPSHRYLAMLPEALHCPAALDAPGRWRPREPGGFPVGRLRVRTADLHIRETPGDSAVLCRCRSRSSKSQAVVGPSVLLGAKSLGGTAVGIFCHRHYTDGPICLAVCGHSPGRCRGVDRAGGCGGAAASHDRQTAAVGASGPRWRQKPDPAAVARPTGPGVLGADVRSHRRLPRHTLLAELLQLDGTMHRPVYRVDPAREQRAKALVAKPYPIQILSAELDGKTELLRGR